jgi:hypothetical protein
MEHRSLALPTDLELLGAPEAGLHGNGSGHLWEFCQFNQDTVLINELQRQYKGSNAQSVLLSMPLLLSPYFNGVHQTGFRQRIGHEKIDWNQINLKFT